MSSHRACSFADRKSARVRMSSDSPQRPHSTVSSPPNSLLPDPHRHIRSFPPPSQCRSPTTLNSAVTPHRTVNLPPPTKGLPRMATKGAIHPNDARRQVCRMWVQAHPRESQHGGLKSMRSLVLVTTGCRNRGGRAHWIFTSRVATPCSTFCTLTTLDSLAMKKNLSTFIQR